MSGVGILFRRVEERRSHNLGAECDGQKDVDKDQVGT